MNPDTRITSLGEIVRNSLLDIIEFAKQPAFVALMETLYSEKSENRTEFVEKVVLNEEQRLVRGVKTPSDLCIQKSVFGDGRPTLFCVSKRLPEGLPHGWYKVTITFDNEGNLNGIFDGRDVVDAA